MQQSYVLPRKVVHCVAIAFVASVLLNIFDILSETVLFRSSDNDHNSIPITLRPAALTVVATDRYALDSNEDWSSLIPNGHGFVRLGADEKYFALSMYHQMHCLNGFRRMALAGKNVTEHNIEHAIHCLSYLRQMVLCNADTTLEPAHSAPSTNGGTTQAVYGEGVTHQCRDWTQVREWVEQNYAEWEANDHFEVSEGQERQPHKAHGHGSDHAHAPASGENHYPVHILYV